jgi:tRNA-dihydrouridine synthase 3
MGNGSLIYVLSQSSLYLLIIISPSLYVYQSINQNQSLSQCLLSTPLYSNYGLEHWGSDHQGINTTRRFLLEWLSFLHRYVPVGILKQSYPQSMNQQPPQLYFGRCDLETILSSANAQDWVKLSEMFLGKVSNDYSFIPKHKANSYSVDIEGTLTNG